MAKRMNEALMMGTKFLFWKKLVEKMKKASKMEEHSAGVATTEYVCLTCKVSKSKSGFSKAQLKKKDGFRKCLVCVGSAQDSKVQTATEEIGDLLSIVTEAQKEFGFLDNELFKAEAEKKEKEEAETEQDVKKAVASPEEFFRACAKGKSTFSHRHPHWADDLPDKNNGVEVKLVRVQMDDAVFELDKTNTLCELGHEYVVSDHYFSLLCDRADADYFQRFQLLCGHASKFSFNLTEIPSRSLIDCVVFNACSALQHFSRRFENESNQSAETIEQHRFSVKLQLEQMLRHDVGEDGEKVSGLLDYVVWNPRNLENCVIVEAKHFSTFDLAKEQIMLQMITYYKKHQKEPMGVISDGVRFQFYGLNNLRFFATKVFRVDGVDLGKNLNGVLEAKTVKQLIVLFVKCFIGEKTPFSEILDDNGVSFQLLKPLL
jgi:hypothetical protein